MFVMLVEFVKGVIDQVVKSSGGKLKREKHEKKRECKWKYYLYFSLVYKYRNFRQLIDSFY